MLPPLPGDVSAWVAAISDHGLVAGTSTPDPNYFKSSAVLWRDTGAPLDLGFSGRPTPGISIKASAVDVNENGAVAVEVVKYKGEGEVRESGWVWRDGVRNQLRTTAKRRWSTVNALNDHGVAVGSIGGRSTAGIPVAWRRGRIIRLALPPRAQYGEAIENNNRAVVIGTVGFENKEVAWWWRLGGRSGPLRAQHGRLLAHDAVDIDDHNRIVGTGGFRARPPTYFRPATVLWPRPRMAPRALTVRWTPVALDAGRHLVGDVKYGERPWIARLNGPAARLPSPPTSEPGGWDNIEAVDLAQGMTPFAPDGGITVGGYATRYNDTTDQDISHPTLWTCAQTYA